MRKWTTTSIFATATLVVGLLVGMALSHDVMPSPETKQSALKSMAISEGISGEAREYCLGHGMTVAEIAVDQDVCLRKYWTIDKLQRSERLQNDWNWDNGYYEKYCGETSRGATVCGLIGSPGFPDDDDPWWDEQAVRDPGRTTMPGVGERITDTYNVEAARDARDSAQPVSVSTLALANKLKGWCTTEPDRYGHLKKTRAYTAQEIEADVRPCLVDWFAR